MNLKEYNEVKSLSYQQYCEYLKKKYGMVPYKYGDERNHKLGLYIHHIGEDKIPGLSSRKAQITEDCKYQLPDMLCYCDYLEHFLLHLKIGEIGADSVILAMGGLETWIKPALINFFNYGKKNFSVGEEYYTLIQNDKDVFELLMQKHDALVKEQDCVFDHNAALFLQLDEMRTNKGRALVVLGTGLGKTTTGLQYLKKHNIRALVLGPNNLIKNGWDNYPEYCDTRTYQAFSNIYEKIDYSKYGCVILDEAHHAIYDEESERGAETWGKAINYLINNGIKVLGLTATPDRTDGLSLGETLFKDCICKGLSVEEGIENGILHPFSYITSIYDKDGIIKYLPNIEDDEKYIKLRGQLDLALNNLPTIPETLLKYMPHNNRKGIIFVQDIDDMDEALKIFRKAFPNEEVRFLHSKQTKTEQDESREWFKKTTKGYLIAVNMITEGAHYDGVNTLIRFRRTESYLLYTQQLGRIITLTTKKNPEAIVFDLVNNINSVRYNDRVSGRHKEPANKGVLKVLREIANSKSAQIIIANEAQDIVNRLEQLKQYASGSWEDWEIDILKKYYPEMGAKGCLQKINSQRELQRLPARSLGALAQKASELGIKSLSHYWSDEDVSKLIECYKKYGRTKCADLFPDRSITAVLSKIDDLNISQSRSYSSKELKILRDNYEIKSIYELMGLLPGRSKDSIIKKAQDLGLHSSYNLPWSSEEIEILKNDKELSTRSFNACKTKCRELNIYHHIYRPNTHYWTTEENEMIKKYYPIEGRDCCKRFPNRSEASVVMQARKLGVKSCRKAVKIMVAKTSKKVRCIETGEVFNSISQANKTHPGASNLKKVIDGERSFAGRLPDGTPLHWEYVKDSDNN